LPAIRLRLAALVLALGGLVLGSGATFGSSGNGLGAANARGAGPRPGAGTGPGRPLQIKSASLTQDGQDIVWRLELTGPFSPGALAGDRRSLCLLIERAGTGSVAGEVCLAGPKGSSSVPRLFYMPITRRGVGPGRLVTASIGRSSNRELRARFLPSAAGLSYQPLRWQVISTLRPPGCVPLVPDRAGCYTLYPARPTLVSLSTPLPTGCVPAGPALVFNGPRNQRVVALTFDDGPWPSPPTSQFLDVLERSHAVATFFEIGSEIGPYDPGGGLERRMLADGDLIGNHTWTHPDMTRLDSSTQRSQLEQTSAAIKAASGFTPCLWRPPYGAQNSGVVGLARSLGLITVNWDVDTVDWSTPGTSTIYQRAVDGARPGSIILQHFGGGPRYQTLAALPQEISTLRQRGYRFVTVAELLGLRLIYK
jgi:peptidoglycan/xylan/chitin deacetylase (PgdA/CDA1 family)